jgi:pimeloyl-ACP methyl ester carboxylesterase
MPQIKSVGMCLGLAYITIETYRYIRFIQIRNWLRNSQTPLSRDFSHEEWFDFFISRIKQNPHTFQKLMECVFWNRPYETIDKASINVCLLTLASASEIHQMERLIGKKQQIERNKQIVGEIVEEHTKNNPIVSDKLLHFVRIDDPITHHGQANPLFHPLPLALAFSGLRYYGNKYLYNSGYTHYTTDNGFVFWIKEMKRKGKTLCFLHGLGFGAIPYIQTIERIAKLCGYDNVIFVEMPGISGHPHPKVKITAQETAETICGVIRKFPNIDVIAHSYGTCVLTYIENRYPEFFRKSIYVEPTCFFPVNTKYWPIAFKQMSWFANAPIRDKIMDIGLSEQYSQHLIHNHVYMYEFVNRDKKMTKNTMIVLSGNDDMVPSQELYEYIQTNYPDVVLQFCEKHKHGALLSKRNQTYYDKIISDFL